MIQEAIIDIFYKSGFILLPLFIVGFFSWVLIIELFFFFIKEAKKKKSQKQFLMTIFSKKILLQSVVFLNTSKPLILFF